MATILNRRSVRTGIGAFRVPNTQTVAVRNSMSRQADIGSRGTGLSTGHVPRLNVSHVRNPAARGR